MNRWMPSRQHRWGVRYCHGLRPAAAVRKTLVPQEGQSLVEFALALPVFLLLLLGGANLGLALRAHLQLSQIAQQGAQMLLHHPDYADNLVLTISGASSGTFTLTTSGGTGGTTGNITYSTSLTAATVQGYLAALPDVGTATGNVTVTGPNGGPFTVIFGGMATATGLSVDGSGLGTGSATVTPPLTLVAYMNSLSSYQLTPSQVTVTSGTTTVPSGLTCTPANSLTNKCAAQDTVTINYPFQVLFPMIGRLSVGLLRNGSINLGVSESSVVATHPVSNVQVCDGTSGDCSQLTTPPGITVGAKQHLIIWQTPPEAQSATNNVPIAKVCITAYFVPNGSAISIEPGQPGDVIVEQSGSNGCVGTGTTGLLKCDTAPTSGPPYCLDSIDYADQFAQPSSAPDICSAPPPPTSTSANLCWAANPTQVYYRVAAQQVNGVTSTYSVRVDGP